MLGGRRRIFSLEVAESRNAYKGSSDILQLSGRLSLLGVVTALTGRTDSGQSLIAVRKAGEDIGLAP
jgi:hypothetical protein